MSEKTKPRLCEVLGVEVGEKFEIYSTEYYIDERGNLLWNEGGHLRSSASLYAPHLDDLCCAIKDVSIVEHRVQLTDKDIQDAKMIAELFSPTIPVFKMDDGLIVGDRFSKFTNFYGSYFPTIPPFRRINLENALNGFTYFD